MSEQIYKQKRHTEEVEEVPQEDTPAEAHAAQQRHEETAERVQEIDAECEAVTSDVDALLSEAARTSEQIALDEIAWKLRMQYLGSFTLSAA
jgi:hypothetical protein